MITLDEFTQWVNKIPKDKPAMIDIVGSKICVGNSNGLIQIINIATGEITNYEREKQNEFMHHNRPAR